VSYTRLIIVYQSRRYWNYSETIFRAERFIDRTVVGYNLAMLEDNVDMHFEWMRFCMTVQKFLSTVKKKATNWLLFGDLINCKVQGSIAGGFYILLIGLWMVLN
jgi:hypothetical protein